MTDKIKHIIISTAIALLISLFVGIWALPITLLVGFGKELIWDRWMGKGQFEWADLWCDFWGAIVGTTIGITINIIFFHL